MPDSPSPQSLGAAASARATDTRFAVRAASLWMALRRHQGASLDQLAELLGYDRRAAQRQLRELRRAGLRIRARADLAPNLVGAPLTLEKGLNPPHPEAKATLSRWVPVLLAGGIDLTRAPAEARIAWYRSLGPIQMIGTPPWEPHDYVSADVHQRVIYLRLPAAGFWDAPPRARRVRFAAAHARGDS